MDNIVDIKYDQTGLSSQTNSLGIRQMQAKVYEAKDKRFLLVKAPPASGKSRALMFVALDKLVNQGVKRVVVAVPEKSIGRSFKDTDLMRFGFFADWKVARYFNLCDQIVSEQLDDLKATVLQNPMIVKALGGNTSPEVINKVVIPKIIQETYPNISEDENEEIRQRLLLEMVVKGKEEQTGADGNRFVKLTNTFINIEQLSISLINTINPFQRAYEIMSKEVTAPVLKVIQDTIAEKKMPMTIEEAVILYKGPYQLYKQSHANPPSLNHPDPKVQRLAQAINVIKNYKIRKEMGLDYEPSIKRKGDS